MAAAAAYNLNARLRCGNGLAVRGWARRCTMRRRWRPGVEGQGSAGKQSKRRTTVRERTRTTYNSTGSGRCLQKAWR